MRYHSLINRSIEDQSLATGGFTIVELMVAMGILGVIMTVGFTGYTNSRRNARDVIRKTDLELIKQALEAYKADNNTYIVANSGWSNGGQGWFSYEDGAAYVRSVARALKEAGYALKIHTDPLPKNRFGNPDQGYMIYLCNSNNIFAISATLENPTSTDITNIQSSCNGTGANGTYDSYGKNYAVTYP